MEKSLNCSYLYDCSYLYVLSFRSISIEQNDLDPEKLNPEKKKISEKLHKMPLKLVQLLMLILMAVLFFACAAIHQEVLQRWKTVSVFNAEDIIYLREKVDETLAVSEDLGNMNDEVID